MNAITFPMAIYKDLIMSSAEWLADTRVQMDHEQNVKIYLDDQRTELLVNLLGDSILKIEKLPPETGEAHCG